MSNKRGDVNWQLVMIVIAVIALVIIVYSFYQRNKANEQGLNAIIPSVISGHINSCIGMCEANNDIDYCNKKLSVGANNIDSSIKTQLLAVANVIVNQTTSNIDYTCYQLSLAAFAGDKFDACRLPCNK